MTGPNTSVVSAGKLECWWWLWKSLKSSKHFMERNIMDWCQIWCFDFRPAVRIASMTFILNCYQSDKGTRVCGWWLWSPCKPVAGREIFRNMFEISKWNVKVLFAKYCQIPKSKPLKKVPQRILMQCFFLFGNLLWSLKNGKLNHATHTWVWMSLAECTSQKSPGLRKSTGSQNMSYVPRKCHSDQHNESLQ